MRILVIRGPNLNMLSKREKWVYGEKTVNGINALLKKEAPARDAAVVTFQSNRERALVDFIPEQPDFARGTIIKQDPNALRLFSA